VVLKWFRSRARKREEPAGETCPGCLSSLTGSSEDQRRASGAVFMEAVGWFCGPPCERQYRFRFRIQPRSSSAGTASVPPVATAPVVAPPPPEGEASEMTVDELMTKLRERRRRLAGRY
jgi:hypothetical protein